MRRASLGKDRDWCGATLLSPAPLCNRLLSFFCHVLSEREKGAAEETGRQVVVVLSLPVMCF